MEDVIKKYSEFENCFGDIEQIFEDFRDYSAYGNDHTKRFIFIPPRSNERLITLAVAHLDTVQSPRLDEYDDTLEVWSGAGFDDRSGLYACMKLYQQRDNVAVLLTDNEETGQTTAQWASEPLERWMAHTKQYISLMIEFDRAENDFVFYEYYSGDINTIMSRLGVSSGVGSYSDICWLQDLDVCGINLGIGYINAHSTMSYQSMPQLEHTIRIGTILADKAREDFFENEPWTKQFSRGRWPNSAWGGGTSYTYKDSRYFDDYEEEDEEEAQAKAYAEYAEELESQGPEPETEEV